MTRTACWYRSARALAVATLATAAFLVLAVPAQAADAEEEDELAEVQITGTRIQSPNVTSSNPVTSITGEEMRQLGIINVADALLQLVPQNISTYQPGLVGDIQTSGAGELGNIGSGFGAAGSNDVDRGSFFIGQTVANLRGMDPQFGSRTLTMIDGRRVVSSSSQADIVDMNIIPSNLLQRMDVVTGGASASYGSGAMAGVVNLVLNNRLTGFNADIDYGVNEAGDGSSPHVSVSGGLPLFGGRAHALIGVEWQNSSAIRDCAAARDWCAESRTMFTNSGSSISTANQILIPLPGFEGFPARFEMANVRFSQFSPNGVIYENNSSLDLAAPPPTSGYRFTSDGTGVEEFAYGFRGSGASASSRDAYWTVMNGDGPLATSGSSLRSGSERKSMFSNFEFNLTERTTAYLQTSYATTDSENKNRYTTSTACARFDAPGVAAIAGGERAAGQVIYFGKGTIVGDQFVLPISPYNQLAGPEIVRDVIWTNRNFQIFIGNAPVVIASGITARSAPYLINANTVVGARDTPVTFPAFAFSANVVPNSAQWMLVKSPNSETRYWMLTQITLAVKFEDPGTPALLPPTGRNSYAFLNQLSPEALYQVQSAFNRSPGAGGANSATAALWGQNPCTGFTAIKKVWNPQIQQHTTQESDTWRAVAGMRGRFGRDWKWDAYYQYGSTESLSKTFNGATNLSFNFAMDAVIDDRVNSATFGKPVCRITRDGVPQLDTTGVFMSDTAGLQALAADCQPLNIFGVTSTPWEGLDMTAAEMAEMQQQALEYAFKDSSSEGSTSLQTLSINTNGTLWQGWGAGPLTGAFGVELSENKVDNVGTRGSFYLRSDLSSWNDAFGGKTRSTEGFTELNLPLVSGQPGVNLWSVNGAARYTSYYNKGGAGTTGESATQGTFNWKVSTVFEPFDWVRLRVTRSRDMRAAGYRDLFLNQPTLPDQVSGRNWWRENTEISNENQTERYGYVRVGNADLKPEASNTLTLGLVLSPGGWAQGMRLSADYFNIRVKHGIYTPYSFASAGSIIEACWRGSGNNDDPDNLVQGMLPDLNVAECKEITFHANQDGSVDTSDIIYVNSSRPDNGLPYQRRGLDLAWNYMFPLARAFESLPGSLSLTLRASRTLEASGLQQTVVRTGDTCALVAVDSIFRCAELLQRVDLVGQIRTSQFIPGVSASPKWAGNIQGTYILGDLTTSLSARYTCGAFQDKTWSDDPTSPAYRAIGGQLLNGSVDNNWVKPYFNFSLNGSYNLKVANLKQFQVFGSINNLFDKSPPFTGGGSLSGASAQYHDTMGRAYRMGVRMKF